MTAGAASGYTANGLAYNRFGLGTRPVVVLAGLGMENVPVAGMAAGPLLGPFRCLEPAFDVWFVNRRRDLPTGVTIEGLADDYATWMRDALVGPVDVIGVSTGGSIAQALVLRHPQLVARLVLYSAAHRLGDRGRAFQRELASLARAGRVREVIGETLVVLAVGPGRPRMARLVRPAFRVLAALLPRPGSVADFVATVEAEDAFDVLDRLGAIAAPTLVIGGGRDPFYEADLFEATARGIPGARLLLDPHAGHVPSGPAIRAGLLGFLAASPVGAGSAAPVPR